MNPLVADHSLWANENPSDTISTPHVSVQLIADYRSVKIGQQFWLGLHFTLKPGWHIYYLNPGDSGLPPKVSFNEQSQFTIENIAWPTPKRLPFGPLVNYGYDQEVVLPIKVTVNDAASAGPLSLVANASWLVCEEDCIPEKGTLTLPMMVSGESVESVNSPKLAKLVRDLPQPLANGTFELHESASELELTLPDSVKGSDYFFFPALKGITKSSAEQSLWKAINGTTILKLQRATAFKGLPALVPGIITYRDVLGELRSLSVQASAMPTLAASNYPQEPQTSPNSSLIFILLSAFIGGMILNLMPCVLPVLSFKVLSLVNQAEDSKSHQLLLAFFYTLGIVSSLVALGGLLLALRAQGASIGWGFQLQYAPVIGFLALFFFVLGLSFLGFIEFGAQVASKACQLDRKEGIGGAFLSGLLATLVATPCTAPFLGTAVGFALIRPWFQALSIFVSMGLGIAFPYVLLIAVPKARSILPRPGSWMVTFRELLAFPLFATSLWLLWILSIQRGGQGVLLVLLAALILVFGLWILRNGKTGVGPKRTLSYLVGISITALGIVTVILPDLLSLSREEVSNQDGTISDIHGLTWIPYSANTLKQFREQGKTVYLDFTAAWCITCQVNKNVVFSDQRVIDLIKSNGIILMRADWTNQDPLISKALEDFGRGSVPYNVIFRGNSKSPLELPTILTPNIVLNGLIS